MASKSSQIMGCKRGTKINVDKFAHRFSEILNPELVWFSQNIQALVLGKIII